MKWLRYFLIVLPILVLAACSDEKARRQENQPAELNDQVARLKWEQFILSTALDRLTSNRWVMLDMSQKGLEGFKRINTDVGSFFIGCEDAIPYLDGYKVQLKIGNPSSARYHGLKVAVRWGKAMPKGSASSAAINEWMNSLREREAVFTETLEPGALKKIEISVSPAKSNELGYLLVRMETVEVPPKSPP